MANEKSEGNEDCVECRASESVVRASDGRRTCSSCGETWTRIQWKAAEHKAANPGTEGFVTECLHTWGARYDYQSQGMYLGDEGLTPASRVVDKIYLASERWGFSRERIQAALRIWMAEEDRKVLERYRAWAAGPPGGWGPEEQRRGRYELRRWMCAVCEPGHRALSFYVMMHFLWQVKRKLLGRPVDQHICPVLTGKPGGGKSYNIRHNLLGAIPDLVGEAKLSALSDERHHFQFARDYVVLLDEFAGAKKADIEAVKALITGEKVFYRELGHNSRVVAPHTATFIGTANYDLHHILNDPTGARRFWELRGRDRLDWDKLDSLDYAAVWRGVDPAVDSPLSGEVLEKVQAAQHKYLRTKTPIDEFLDEMEWIPEAFEDKRNLGGLRGDDLWVDLARFLGEKEDDTKAKRVNLGLLGKSARFKFGRRFETKRVQSQGSRQYLWPLKRRRQDDD